MTQQEFETQRALGTLPPNIVSIFCGRCKQMTPHYHTRATISRGPDGICTVRVTSICLRATHPMSAKEYCTDLHVVNMNSNHEYEYIIKKILPFKKGIINVFDK
jgi:hypothetical protein